MLFYDLCVKLGMERFTREPGAVQNRFVTVDNIEHKILYKDGNG